MKCEEARKYMYPMLDNELGTEKNLDVLAHLNVCDRCQEQFEAEKEFLSHLSDSFSGRTVPDELMDQLDDQLNRAKSNRSLMKRFVSGVERLLPAAAAAIFVIAAGLISYLAFTLDRSASSAEILQRLPEYHMNLMDSNKGQYLDLVNAGSFQSNQSLRKNLSEQFRPLQQDVNIPSLDSLQCKILKGSAVTGEESKFGVPYYRVVYCYLPGEDGQRHEGITHFAFERPLDSPGTLTAVKKLQKKGDLYYYQDKKQNVKVVFWGTRKYMFAMLADDIQLSKFLDFASEAQKQSISNLDDLEKDQTNHF